MKQIIQNLIDKGWSVKQDKINLSFPSDIEQRFTEFPESFIEFLETISECVSPDSKSWLLCISDYLGISESSFKWDEFEQLSLEVADDEEWENEIKEFWDKHFPIYVSVRNGYEYAAICLGKENFGKIVFGGEPEFEEIEIVSDSYEKFLRKLYAITHRYL